MNRQGNSAPNYSQDSRTLRWNPTSAETTTSASDLGFCEVNPIVITPDMDNCSDEHPGKKQEKIGDPRNAVSKNMMQFQVQDQQFAVRKAQQHAVFQNADLHQREIPVTNFPPPAHQPSVYQEASGYPVLRAVMTDTGSLPQTLRQNHHLGVTTPPIYTDPAASGKIYPLPMSDCSVASSRPGIHGARSNIPVPVNQFNYTVEGVRLQASRDVPAAPTGFSGEVLHQQHLRRIPDAQQGKVFYPCVTSSQANPGMLPGFTQDAGSLPSQQSPSPVIVHQQAQPSIVIHVRQSASLPSETQDPMIQNSMPQQLSTASVRDMLPKDPASNRPRFSTSSQDHLRMLQVMNVDIKSQPIDDFPDVKFQPQDQVFNQTSRRPRSALDIQNVRQQSLDRGQGMQQWAAASMSGKNCQPFGSSQGSTLQPRGAVNARNSRSEDEGRAGQTLLPVGGQGFMLQGSVAERGLSTQSAAIGETSQSQGYQGRLNNLPLNALQGQNAQSQSFPRFQSQSSLTGQGFQQSGQTFQPQGPAYGQGPRPQSLGVGSVDSNLLPQSSFGDQLQSHDDLFGNISSLAHAQNLQQQSSVGFGTNQNTGMSTRFQVPSSTRPSSQSQYPVSTESRAECPQRNQPLPESRLSPEFVNSGTQHQFGGRPPSQIAENLTMGNSESSLTLSALNQNAESNQHFNSEAMIRAMQEMLSNPNSPALSSLSDVSFQSCLTSVGHPTQTYGAVPGLQSADDALGNFQQQLQQQAVQQQQQQKMEEEKATQQQLVQQQLQQLQHQQQLQQQQDLQDQMLQQQFLQQLGSGLGSPYPAQSPAISNQTLFANSAPAAAPGADLMSQLLPFMMANHLSQSFQSYNNPSFNAFSMPQPSLQQQLANILAASMAQSFGLPSMAPTGLETNPMASLLCQMLRQAPAPPQPVQPSDGGAANSMMQMMMQSLRGADVGGGASAGQQLLKSLFGSASESGSRPSSVGGLGLDVSQQGQLPFTIDEQSVHSLAEPPPDVGSSVQGVSEPASDIAAQASKPSSARASPVKQKKGKAMGRSPKKMNPRPATRAKDKGASVREDTDKNENDASEMEDAGEDDVEGDDDDDDDAGNANPKVYIDVAWDSSCLPAKTGPAKSLSPSKRVIENGRRIAAKRNQKKAGRGKDPVDKTLKGGLVGSGRKRKSDEAKGTRSKRGRLSTDEEKDDAASENSSSEAEPTLKRTRKTPAKDERTSSLRSGGKEGGTAVQGSRGKSKAVASRGKVAASSSIVNRGNVTEGKGVKQEPGRKVDDRTSHSRAKTGKGKEKQIHAGDLEDTKKAGKTDKARKTEEGTSHAGSSDTNDSSNSGVSNDVPDSSSGVKSSPAKGSQEAEKYKMSLQCTKNQPVISMSKLSVDQVSEVLGVRKCRLKQLATPIQPPDSDSDNDRHGSYSDSSSSGDFGPKSRSKSGRRRRSPTFKLTRGKRTAATGKNTGPGSVGGTDNRSNVALVSSNIRVLQEGESQGNLGPTATTSAEAPTLVPATVGYVKRSRGRPSLFQTFQADLPVANITATTSTAAAGDDQASPAMPVLLRETTVRAVARISPLVPPAVDEALKAKLALVELTASVNEHIGSQLQTVFVKLDEASDVMNVLISFKALGDNMVFQCTFCSFTDFSAKVVSDHVRRSHLNYMFAATRTPMPTGDVMYLFCRHCSFVTHDRISMWIHFEICHGVPDIVYGSNVSEVTPQVTRQLVLNRDQQAVVSSFYQCVDCEILVADNRHIADHAVKNHGEDGSCYRGCFAKARVINKPKSAPITVTYNQLLGDEYVDQRKEVFICVRCSYTAYAEYLAISHHITSHLDLRMVFACHIEGCMNREATPDAAVQHVKANHADTGSRILRGTVTLVTQSSGDSSVLKECELRDN